MLIFRQLNQKRARLYKKKKTKQKRMVWYKNLEFSKSLEGLKSNKKQNKHNYSDN
jgi:hypothetical protein